MVLLPSDKANRERKDDPPSEYVAEKVDEGSVQLRIERAGAYYCGGYQEVEKVV